VPVASTATPRRSIELVILLEIAEELELLLAQALAAE
jgi:hypothetical protein